MADQQIDQRGRAGAVVPVLGRHPGNPGTLDVAQRVVDEQHLLTRRTEVRQDVLEEGQVRLGQADLAGVVGGVEDRVVARCSRMYAARSGFWFVTR